MRIYYFARIDISVEDASTRHVFEFCRHFARLGHQVDLFVPDMGGRRELAGVSFIHVPVLIRKPAVTFFSFYFFLFFSFLRNYFKAKPDVVYTRHQQMEWLVTWLRFILGFTYVIEINGLTTVELVINSASSWIIDIVRVLESCVLRLPDRIVTSSVRIRDALCRDYNLKAEHFLVVSNGADPQNFRPMERKACRQKLGLDVDGVYLIFTGSFKKWHGLELIVRIMPELLKAHPGIRLLVVGEGAGRRLLEKIISDSGLEKQVFLLGKKSFAEMPYYIGAGDICLAPYGDDQLNQSGISPLKLFEYMACERPVIANPVGGLDILFQTYNIGVLVSPNSPQAWKESIESLINDPQRGAEYGRNGRSAVLREFNWETICKKIEKELQAINNTK